MAEESSEQDKPQISRAERATAERLKAARAERRREWLIVGGVVAVVVAVFLAFVLWPSGEDANDDDSANEDAPAVAEVPTDLTGEVTDDYGFAFGETDAPNRVVIYEDFLCPYCGQLEETSNDDLIRLIDSGDAVVEYRVFNLLSSVGDYSLRSASAMSVVMEQSGPRVAKTFHDLLYENQPSESGEMPDNDWLVEQAVVAGADEDAVRTGIESVQYSEYVDEATQAAVDSGVTSTPTVYVNGEQISGNTVDELSANMLAAAGG